MIGFAKKIGMTRLFLNGKSTAVTALLVDQNVVVQTKTVEKDGYSAVQIGAFTKKVVNKARQGHVTKHAGVDHDFQCFEEFRDVNLEEGKKVFDISDIAQDDELDITGTTKGRGFAGPVKRYGFAGQPASHGHDHVRGVGSIGSRWPQRVSKGKRMAGQMGNESVTVKNLKVVGIDAEKGLVFVAGSVPGANSNYVKFRKVTK